MKVVFLNSYFIICINYISRILYFFVNFVYFIILYLLINIFYLFIFVLLIPFDDAIPFDAPIQINSNRIGDMRSSAGLAPVTLPTVTLGGARRTARRSAGVEVTRRIALSRTPGLPCLRAEAPELIKSLNH